MTHVGKEFRTNPRWDMSAVGPFLWMTCLDAWGVDCRFPGITGGARAAEGGRPDRGKGDSGSGGASDGERHTRHNKFGPVVKDEHLLVDDEQFLSGIDCFDCR